MANITDAEAVRFCNEWARPAADRLAQRYYTAKALVNEWNARTMSTKIPNTADVIVDGSGGAGDGRPGVTAAQITAIITRAQEIAADYEATSNAKLNTVLAVAVNPQG
jgi:hypothetical protein